MTEHAECKLDIADCQECQHAVAQQEIAVEIDEMCSGLTLMVQPLPTPNDATPIVELVIADLRERERVGRAKYGTSLQAFNGRDALRDMYAEDLDRVQYGRQALIEWDAMKARIVELESALKEACDIHDEIGVWSGAATVEDWLHDRLEEKRDARIDELRSIAVSKL
jgi:hypothetical protein